MAAGQVGAGRSQPCQPASSPAVPWVVVVTESLFLPSSLCLCWFVELRHHQPPEHSSWRVDDVSGVSVLFFFCWEGDGGPFQLRVLCDPVHLAPRSKGQSWELPGLAQTGGDTVFILFISPFIFLFSPYPLFHRFFWINTAVTLPKIDLGPGIGNYQEGGRGKRGAALLCASALVWPGAQLPLAVGQC